MMLSLFILILGSRSLHSKPQVFIPQPDDLQVEARSLPNTTTSTTITTEEDRIPELFEASRTGDVELLQELLDEGYSSDERDSQGNTLLIHAASNGHSDIAQLLLQNGADVNAKNSRDQ